MCLHKQFQKGVEGGVVDLPLHAKFFDKTSDENPLLFNVLAALVT